MDHVPGQWHLQADAVMIVVVDSLINAAEAALTFGGNPGAVASTLVAAIGFPTHVIAQLFLRRVFKAQGEPIAEGTVQLHALLTSDFSGAPQITEARLRVPLVAAALLALAELVDVFSDRSVAWAVDVRIRRSLEHAAIVQEHAHREHGLDIAASQVPFAVG